MSFGHISIAPREEVQQNLEIKKRPGFFKCLFIHSCSDLDNELKLWSVKCSSFPLLYSGNTTVSNNQNLKSQGTFFPIGKTELNHIQLIIQLL